MTERPLDPEDFEALFTTPEPDGDAVYEERRQQEIDDLYEKSVADSVNSAITDIFGAGYSLKEQAE